MKRLSYQNYLPDILRVIEPKLTYSFDYLSNQALHQPWAISRTTLMRARRSGELICNNTTTVKGEWLLDWLLKTPEQRHRFADSKAAKQFKRTEA